MTIIPIFSYSGLNAASLTTAQNYIDAFQQLACKNNTLILPSNVADISGVVGSAVSIYNNLSRTLQNTSKESALQSTLSSTSVSPSFSTGKEGSNNTDNSNESPIS